ncbi:hypothetical protein [Nitrososphaera sp.]|uniref:hypothetical protein n=1 Tax=Nitrososphaera sp. TaxID=1971748 RepID=UPI00307D2DE7
MDTGDSSSKERSALYAEFEHLGIPTDKLHPLSNPALKQLLDSIKEAILSYKDEQKQGSGLS